jgi:pimeloyl-ACP methyl ester carboxylesterase
MEIQTSRKTPEPAAPIMPHVAIPAIAAVAHAFGHTAFRETLSLCFLVYAPLKHARAELEHAGYSHVRSFSKFYTGTQVLCGVKNGKAYVAFRGSESILDWMVDFLCIPFFLPARHLGFSLAWRSVHKNVRGWLNEVAAEKVVLCGHSLGGAVSHLAAFDLAAHYPLSDIVTFGAPKACYLGTAKKYNGTPVMGNAEKKLGDITFCAVNQRDIVARVPPSLLGFRDVGQLVFIDAKNAVHEGDEALKARDGLRGGDADYLIGFFYTTANDDGMTDYFRLGVRWLCRTLPFMQLALLPPVFYVLVVSYFARSGLSHMTGKYVNVFFKGGGPSFRAYVPSRANQIISGLFAIAFLVAAGAGLVYGFYHVAAWSFTPLFGKK